MTKKFEDFLFADKHPILRFSEYRSGSSEYGQIFQDLMMILRSKKEENKDDDFVILTKKDLVNFNTDKLFKLLTDKKKLGRNQAIEVG